MAIINPGTTYDAPNVALMKRSLDENILNLDPRDLSLIHI